MKAKVLAGMFLCVLSCRPVIADPPFETSVTPHFVFHFVKGTAAERDLKEIASRREEAYRVISKTLGVTLEHPEDMFLYPTRASTPSGFGAGSTSSDGRTIRVNYFDFAPSYERTRFGHELTHALAYRLAGRHHPMPLLAEGLAEALDQSGRNFHEWLSYYLRAFEEMGPLRVLKEELGDAARTQFRGEILYTKGASLVRLLVDEFGWPKFVEFYRETMDVDALAPAERLTRLGEALRRVYGVDLSSVEKRWNRTVAPFLRRDLPRLAAGDETAIRTLYATQDAAAAKHDAAGVMLAFDAIEGRRIGRPPAIVDLYTQHLQGTDLLEIVDLGIKNGPQALVQTLRRFDDGKTVPVTAIVERMDDGWKIDSEMWNRVAP